MKILTRYTIFSILKTAFVTMLIFALILAAVELFSKMDQIMHNSVPIPSLLMYIILSLPEYLMMAASISFLFAVTYYISMLTANNEMIPILNAGISPVRLRMPIVILAILLTAIGFVFQEHTVIAAANMHDTLEVELFGATSTRDTRNIVLSDEDGFLIYTTRFSESTGEIRSPVLVKTSASGIDERVEAASAYFDENKGWWVFTDARVYRIEDRNVTVEEHESFEEPLVDPEPRLFRSQNTQIDTMDSSTARDYLERLYVSDRSAWQEKATDYARRISEPFAIFVLMIISVCINYRFKKNVLLFSIIQSLSIAVVYYVADMVFSIMGHQGAVTPVGAVILPIVLTIVLSGIISLVGRKA